MNIYTTSGVEIKHKRLLGAVYMRQIGARQALLCCGACGQCRLDVTAPGHEANYSGIGPLVSGEPDSAVSQRRGRRGRGGAAVCGRGSPRRPTANPWPTARPPPRRGRGLGAHRAAWRGEAGAGWKGIVPASPTQWFSAPAAVCAARLTAGRRRRHHRSAWRTVFWTKKLLPSVAVHAVVVLRSCCSHWQMTSLHGQSRDRKYTSRTVVIKVNSVAAFCCVKQLICTVIDGKFAWTVHCHLLIIHVGKRFSKFGTMFCVFRCV